MSATMTDQIPQPASDSASANPSPNPSSDANSNSIENGPSLPKFQPLPPTKSTLNEQRELDDEPSPFISDRIKSGHLGKAEMPKDIWIWAVVAAGLLALAVFGLAQRPSDPPSEVQIVDPQPE